MPLDLFRCAAAWQATARVAMYSCRQAEVPLVWLVQLMCTARAVFPSLRVLLALVVVYPLLPGGRWRALVAMRS